MIHRALLKKYLAESWGLLASCGLGLLLFGWLFIHLIGQFDARFLESVFRRLPAVFEDLLPVPISQLSSFAARSALVYDHPLVLLLIALWCISRSSDVVAGELDRGTLELLLAQPVRRDQLLGSSTVITLLGVMVLSALLWLGVAAGIQTAHVGGTVRDWPLGASAGASSPLRQTQLPVAGAKSRVHGARKERPPLSDLIDGWRFAPAATNTFSLGVFLCGLGTLVSSADRYRWRTIGILAGFVVVQLLLDLLGRTSRPLAWVRWLTFFHAYDPSSFVIQGLQSPAHTWSWWRTTERGPELGVLGADLVLIALGFASLLAAHWNLRRRDIPPPL